MKRPTSYLVFASTLLTGFLLNTAYTSAQSTPRAESVYRQSNLVAWCIVPFDLKKRNPEERAEMLNKLHITKLAYDWRDEHIPTFDAELDALKKHNITL